MTEAQDGAIPDPEVAASPTPVTDTQNADADENKGKLIASLQEKAARVNAAEARAAAAEAETERLRRAQSPAVPATQTDPRQQQLRDTYAWAQGHNGQAPDPVAGVAIQLATDLEMTRQQFAEREALDDIDDKELRKQVKAHLAANRHRLGDVKAAEAEILAGRYATAEAERVRLAEALRTAQAPTGTAPPTHSRDVPASQIKAQTFETLEDFNDAMKGMSTFQRMAMQAEIGKSVKIKRGM